MSYFTQKNYQKIFTNFFLKKNESFRFYTILFLVLGSYLRRSGQNSKESHFVSVFSYLGQSKNCPKKTSEKKGGAKKLDIDRVFHTLNELIMISRRESGPSGIFARVNYLFHDWSEEKDITAKTAKQQAQFEPSIHKSGVRPLWRRFLGGNLAVFETKF